MEMVCENQNSLEQEDDFKTQVMTLNRHEHEIQQFWSLTDSFNLTIDLNKLVKLI